MGWRGGCGGVLVIDVKKEKANGKKSLHRRRRRLLWVLVAAGGLVGKI